MEDSWLRCWQRFWLKITSRWCDRVLANLPNHHRVLQSLLSMQGIDQRCMCRPCHHDSVITLSSNAAALIDNELRMPII
jgi:hypothetical protein